MVGWLALVMAKLEFLDPQWGDIQTITKLLRKERDQTLAKKINVIRLLMKGQKPKAICEFLDVSRNSVHNWRKLWDENGIDGLRNKYQGRRSQVNEEMQAEIQDIIEVRQEIEGKTVTGYLIQGYLKKNSI